eukprot:4450804-Amphidinium_carterae.1
MGRKIYNGSPAELAHIITNYIEKPLDLCYPRKLRAKMVKSTLIEWRDLLKDLSAVQSNLCFTQECMKSAMEIVAKEKNIGDPTFATTTQAMIRTMCHHVYQSFLKA